MKFTIILAAFSALVAASPAMQAAEPVAEEHAAQPMANQPQAAEPMAQVDAAQPEGWGCKPGTYRCSPYRNGWDVCNTGRSWVNGGSCGRRQYCYYNWESKSPYCYNWGTFPKN
ncbi:hypothetical protein OQA88_6245 [Cercophora sp. LCS_1]